MRNKFLKSIYEISFLKGLNCEKTPLRGGAGLRTSKRPAGRPGGSSYVRYITNVRTPQVETGSRGRKDRVNTSAALIPLSNLKRPGNGNLMHGDRVGLIDHLCICVYYPFFRR